MPKNNTGRKESVIYDQLGVKGGGVYCFAPFDNVDATKRTIFKVGKANNFKARNESYLTMFPGGVYIVAFLENPRVIKSEVTKSKTYLYIEREIMEDLDAIQEKDPEQCRRILSTARVRNWNVDHKKGHTEMFYTKESIIRRVFKKAHEEYGGKLHLFFLEGRENKKNFSINDNLKKDMAILPNFVGKVIFKFL